MLSLTHYLFLSFALFFIGLTGVLTRRNVIVKLFSIEIILNATTINFAAYVASGNTIYLVATDSDRVTAGSVTVQTTP